MKANELMIGDLIRMDKAILHVTKLTYGSDYDNCEPIPLTAEILEKNGFVRYSTIVNGYVYYIGDSIDYYLDYTCLDRSLCIKTECYLFDGEVKYVHELQHALRLCGLNDLADNFKV